jgi:hypothetical protein
MASGFNLNAPKDLETQGSTLSLAVLKRGAFRQRLVNGSLVVT